jgi:hypothetical protein
MVFSNSCEVDPDDRDTISRSATTAVSRTAILVTLIIMTHHHLHH